VEHARRDSVSYCIVTFSAQEVLNCSLGSGLGLIIALVVGPGTSGLALWWGLRLALGLRTGLGLGYD